MADNENQNPLDDAVEREETEESSSSGSNQQAQQNQQSTTNVVATGAEAAEAQLAEEALSDGGGDDGADGDEASSTEEDTTAQAVDTQDSSVAQSNVVDADSETAGSSLPESDAPASASDVGTQAVGGESGADASAGASSSSTPSTAQAGSTQATAAQGEAATIATDDAADTATTSEQFEVNVTDGETISDTEEDFDTETTSTTFQIDVTAENDAAEVSGPIDLEMLEDGTIIITQEQLLANASDVDGDDLVAQNLLLTNDAQGNLVDNGDGTFNFTPAQDFNGDISFTYDVFDGTEATASGVNLNVIPVNDNPEAIDKSFAMDEDGIITITDTQLLSGATDIDGDDLSIADVSYTGNEGILTDNGDGTYSFAPNENFSGQVNMGYTVSDGAGGTADAAIDIAVAEVNDAPVSGDLAYVINEDGSITLSQEQLLAQASDVDGDALTASNLQTDNDELTISDNGDGTFTLTPAENFNGDLDITFDVSDGDAVVSAGIDLAVNPVNDLPTATDDYTITAGPGAIRLDKLPEHGVMQHQTPDGNWHDMEVGIEYPANTEVQYVTDSDQVHSDTMDIQVGSFGETANVNDWGAVDGGAAIFTQGDVTITTEVNNGELSAWNGDGHVGNGIGDDTRTGLSEDDTLTVTVEGEDVNCISFELDGLGGWFDATSNQATQVLIKAFDTEGNLIDSQGGFRESGEFQDTYTFSTDTPVHHFELGTAGGKGTYVVKNMTVSRVLNEEIQMTTIQPDGSAISNTVALDLGQSTDGVLNLTDELIEILPNQPSELPIQVEEGGVLTLEPLDLLANDFDIDGDAISIIDVASTENTHGTVELDADGNVIFTPNAEYNGPASFTYTISDEDGLTDTATVYLNVTAENDPPMIDDQQFVMDEDGIITITEADLLQGSFDIDGDDLSVTDVSYSGTDGVLTANGDGTFSFAPNENFSGQVDMEYTVTDGQVKVSAALDVKVREVNDPPIAGSTSFTMDEDSVITLSTDQLLANSSDPEIGVRIEELSYSGTDGILTANDDGTFSFAPNENFNGDISFDMVVSDGDLTDSTTVGIAVGPINDAPVAGDLAYVIHEDGSITLSQEQLLAQASDVDGDDLTASNLQTQNEELTITDNGDGTFTLTPAENFNGDLDITFDVSDGQEVVSAGIDLTVNPVNDLPIAVDKSFAMNEDGIITFTDAQLLAQATDVDGDTLSIADVSYTGNEGVLTDNGDGTYSFAPNENFNGDVGLSYTVSDGAGGTADAAIDIAVAAVNDVPIAGGTSYVMNEDSVITLSADQLLAQSSDIEGDVSLESVSYSGTDGILTANGDGTFSFAPNENFNGSISLDIVVADEEGATAETNAGINVLPINDPPVAGDLAYAIDEDGSITLSQEQLLSRASDVEGDDLTALNLQTENENLTITDNGDGTFTLVPAENFNGDLDISFDVSDGEATVSAGIDLTVNPVNDLPQSGETQARTNEDEAITITQAQLLANAADIDGDALTAGNLQAPNAVITDNGDGTFTILPDQDFNGFIDVSYEINDGTTPISTNLNLTVDPVNDAPVVSQNVPVTIEEDGSYTITQAELLLYATDVEEDDLAARIDGAFENAEIRDIAVPNGVVIDNGDGSYTITPDENFNGEFAINYSVDDGNGGVTPAQIDVNVSSVNDAPDAPSIELQGEEDQVLTIDPAFILSQASDLDGDDLSLVDIQVRQPENATITQNSDGMYQLVTTQDFNGLVELSYTITDGTETVEGELDVDMIPVNDAPFQTNNAHFITQEDEALTFSSEDVLGLFDDVDGDTLSISRIVTADGEDAGEVMDNGDGTFTFVPSDDYAGMAELSVVVSDGEEEAAANLPLFIRPVADGAVITTDHDGPLVFGEDSTGHLGLNVAMLDDSESLSNLVMTGFPVGFVVSDGENVITITREDQMIDITEWSIGDMQLTPPDDFNGSFFVTVSATTIDYGDEPSTDQLAATELQGDFEMNAGESITFTMEELLATATDEEVQEGDITALVHLADRSQGEMVDNGDGTYTFTPNEDMSGVVDFAFVIERDGEHIDVQSSIAVMGEDDTPNNAAPTVDAIASETIEEGNILTFSDEDLLAQISDQDGDALTIESVQAIDGQGMVEEVSEGVYQFVPAEGFVGEAQIGFVASDGTESIRSHMNVNVENGITAVSEDVICRVESGDSVAISQADLLQSLNLSDADSDALSVADVSYSGDAGTLIANDNGGWTFWSDADYSGDIAIDFNVLDGAEVTAANFAIEVQEAAEEDASTDNNAQVADTTNVTPIDTGEADYTAAPGGELTFALPENITENADVEQVVISDLPEGAEVDGALEGAGGDFTITGDLTQAVTIQLGDEFSGTENFQLTGFDDAENPVDAASQQFALEVDEQYAMQANTTDANNMEMAENSGDGAGSDWTDSHNADTSIDPMDDSGLGNNDNAGDPNSGNDLNDLDHIA